MNGPPIGNGGPAFPSGEKYVSTDLSGNKTEFAKGPLHHGLSLRDYFAAHAMAALAPQHARYPSNAQVARSAYELADAMLAERQTKRSK